MKLLLLCRFRVVRDTTLRVTSRQALQLLLAHGFLGVIIRCVSDALDSLRVKVYFEFFLTISVLSLVKAAELLRFLLRYR
jgi:hypothetical protein